MFPKTTSYHDDKDVFYMKHNDLLMTLEEAKAVGKVLESAYRNPKYKAIVIDNSQAKGVWRPEVTEYWNEVTNQNLKFMKKTITLTSSAVATMQINRLSKNFGVERYVRAFQGVMSDEVTRYINS